MSNGPTASAAAGSHHRSPLAQFEAAVQVVDSLPRGASGQAAAFQGFKPSTEMMLRFYALYKQAKFGPCQRQRPAFWDLVGKVKWDAWRALGDMPRERAMVEYARQLRRVIESLPNSSPEVSGLIDKVGSFYRLVESDEADVLCDGGSDGGGASDDIKRGLLLANRIRWRSGGGSGAELDVNSNFLTQSLPPPMTAKAAAAAAAAGSAVSNGVNFGFGLGRRDSSSEGDEEAAGAGSRSQPDLRRPLPGDWSGPDGADPDDEDEDDDNDVFCDSYDNFLLPGDDENDADEQPGDVTGGGGSGARQPQQQPSSSAAAASAAGNAVGGHRGGHGGRRHQAQQQPPPPPPPPFANNGDWPEENGGGGGGGGGGVNYAATDANHERQLLEHLRQIRVTLDRLSGDLGRVNARLDSLDRVSRHRDPRLPTAVRPPASSRLLSLLFGIGGGGGGLSVQTVLLMLAWPVIVQLLWRLPWCTLFRRLLRGGRRGRLLKAGRPV